MPKYRRLSLEELKILEKEFIDFLVLNGMVADEWIALLENDPEKADGIIDAFSDTILAGVLRKTEFLDFISPKKMSAIHFQSDQMVLVTMEVPDNSEADFTQPDYIKQATENPPKNLKGYTSTKPYKETREMTIFQYSEKGWLVSDGKLYKALLLAVVD